MDPTQNQAQNQSIQPNQSTSSALLPNQSSLWAATLNPALGTGASAPVVPGNPWAPGAVAGGQQTVSSPGMMNGLFATPPTATSRWIAPGSGAAL